MELIATAWVVFTIIVGAKGASFWWIPALAVGASVIYLLMRRVHFVRFQSAGFAILTQWIVTIYATQLITIGVLFTIGYGIGKLF
jgi:hypothetical protein